MKRYFLGIDIGTFESRGILIDESFRVAADASLPHGMNNPQPGWFEQDAEAVWWGDLCKLCRTLIKQSGIRPEQIACVGTSALGTDCLPVDEQCRPLRPAILYGIDARASEEAAWLTEHYGQARVQELFGHPICSGDTATKILWLRRHEPEIYAKTAYFLTGSSFLTARLTGKYVIDQSLAKGSFRPLYQADGSVNEAECGLYCRPDQIAACAWSTDIVGTVTPEAAAQTGLATGTPVITGAGRGHQRGSGGAGHGLFSVWLLDVLLLLYGSLRGQLCFAAGQRRPQGWEGVYRAGHLLSGRRHQCGGHIDSLGA